MKRIYLAKHAGFCSGVNHAVNKALSLKSDKPIFCLGELIHNRIINDKLKNMGITIVNSADEIPNESIVIIRSHGVPKATEIELKNKNCEIVDCTCRFVKSIHEICQNNSSIGKSIVIVGKEKHPEVIGIEGYCSNNSTIVGCVEQVPSKLDNNSIVVVQTTFNKKSYENIKKKLENINKTLVFYNTICYTTSIRQSETVNLSKNCDSVIVLGDKSSSNTIELFNLAREYCKNVYLVNSIQELNMIDKNAITNLGITAGASTPKELIEEVILYMSETQDKITVSEIESESKVANATETMADLFGDGKGSDINYKPGKRVKCEIISVLDKGLFVALTGSKKDGFIDKDDICIGEYNKADFKEGDIIEAKVIEKKNNESAISLSRKVIELGLKEDEEARLIFSQNEFEFAFKEKVKGGLKGTLSNFELFLPASQIKAGGKFVRDEELSTFVGKKLKLRVLEEKEGRRGKKTLIVSSRILAEEEKAAKEESFWNSISVNDIITAKVKRVGKTKIKNEDGTETEGNVYGVFVRYNDHDCLVHISDVSWDRIEDPTEILEIGKSYDFIVKELNREKDKISLSYKHLQKTPIDLFKEQYDIGSIIEGTVVKVTDIGAFVNLAKGIDGMVHVSEIAHEYLRKPGDKVKVGDVVTCKIIDINGRRISLSIKACVEPPVVAEVEENNEEYTSNNTAKKSEKMSRFDKLSADRKAKKATIEKKDEEASEYISGNSSTTLADFLKDFKIEE